jgi:hypothetical protein
VINESYHSHQPISFQWRALNCKTAPPDCTLPSIIPRIGFKKTFTGSTESNLEKQTHPAGNGRPTLN